MAALVRVIIEFMRELFSLIKLRLTEEYQSGRSEPLTQKEEADRDIQEFDKATISGNVDDIMRMHRKLLDVAMGAGTATADTSPDDGEGDSHISR
jgi:hypothetical protein